MLCTEMGNINWSDLQGFLWASRLGQGGNLDFMEILN